MTFKNLRPNDGTLVAIAAAIGLLVLFVAITFIPSGFASTNNLRAVDGTCYKASGTLPAKYGSAQEFYDADRTGAEASLLLQQTTCAEDMPGFQG